jgi:hypothetical protein
MRTSFIVTVGRMTLTKALDFDKITLLLDRYFEGLKPAKEEVSRDVISRADLEEVFVWEVDFNIAKIKVACGESPGIEGVCSWIREIRLSNAKFDKGKLAYLEPELYEQAFVRSEPSTRTIYRWYKTDKKP